MKVVILGGSGLIGSKLAKNLESLGHTAVAASPSTGVDSVSGRGLKEAIDGADVVVDVTNSPSFEDEAVLAFFRASTANVLRACKAAGVAHLVALSVVGADRIVDSGYLRAKRVQEKLIESGGVPFTILRATQFFEFLEAIAGAATEGDVVHLSPAKFRPVAADDVAATLATLVVGAPKNGVVELAGPDVSSLDNFIQTFLASRGDARKVVPDPNARYFGAALDANGLAPVAGFVAGRTHFADWSKRN